MGRLLRVPLMSLTLISVWVATPVSGPARTDSGMNAATSFLVGGQVVTTGVIFFGTNGSHELKDNVRHIVRYGDALVPGGLDLSSVLVGHGTARLMEHVDVGVVPEERILEHGENARAEDGGAVSASRKDFLASPERVITVNDVKLGKAGLVPGVGNEGAQLMGSGSVDAEDLDATEEG